MTARWRLRELAREREDGWDLSAREVSGRRVIARVGEDEIVVEGQAIVRRGARGWSDAYRCAGVPETAHVSGDRLLVTTESLEYHHWGYLGPALLIDLETGALVAELRGERAAALDGGRFVLGLEGYGVFDTWLVDRDGALAQTWRSYGHYVVDPDGGVRVVECDRRIPTSARVVRLRMDGSIERGPALAHGQVARPVVLADGTIVVLDAGTLRAFDRELGDAVLAAPLPVEPRDAWRYVGELALDGDRLSVAIVERNAEPPLAYVTHRWTYALTE